MAKVYLYLLRRNKKDVKVIGYLSSSMQIYPTRLADLDLLGLPVKERLALKEIVQNHQVEWEPWLETSDDYKTFKDSLEKRRVTAPSSANSPLISFGIQEIPKTTQIKFTKNRTMTRRMS